MHYLPPLNPFFFTDLRLKYVRVCDKDYAGKLTGFFELLSKPTQVIAAS